MNTQRHPVIGFLAPDGVFTSTTMDKYDATARELCAKNNLKVNIEYCFDVPCGAAMTLMINGYICFTDICAYSAYFKNYEDFTKGRMKWNKENINLVTDQQKQFIEAHENDWEGEQKQDIQEIVTCSDTLYTMIWENCREEV